MRHRLIMLGGGGPGLGKSTLADFLFRQLSARKIPVQWLYEEDAFWLPAMQPFHAVWEGGDPRAIDELLNAAASLTEEWSGDEGVHIVDSFIPGFFLVAGRYPEGRLRQYVADLYRVTEPLNPLLVYLTGDIGAAWERAVAQRGADWGRNIVPYVAGWHMPQYPHTPLRDLDDVIRYFEWVDRQTLRLLDEWAESALILRSSERLDVLEDTLLAHLELERVAMPAAESALEQFTGTYTRTGDEGQETLIIELRDDALWVNSYWPAGARLIPEGTDRFRLAATSRAIVFERDEMGDVRGLQYLFRQMKRPYQKT